MASRDIRPHTGAKFLLSIGLILGSVAYALWQNQNSAATTGTTAPQPVVVGAPAVQTGLYADGTYTGPATDAFYGTVQVEATVSGGKLTSVVFLQHPDGPDTTHQINTQAMPLLIQEAITAQSARVDGVSGATQTSEAFIQSLSAALQKAKV